MDFNFDDIITDIQIHPKYLNKIAVGIGVSLRYIEHEFITKEFSEIRSVQLYGYSKGFRFTPNGNSLISILSNKEMRIYNDELNLQRIITLDEDVDAIGQPFVDENGTNIGIDVLIGTDSGKILGYDTRSNSSKPSITIENHSSTVNIIKSTDWWGCTSIADDGFVILNDFRNKRTAKSEFGPLKSIPKDLCICPYSKKMVVCTYDQIYVFKSYNFDDGPLFKVSPFYDGTTPSACLSLSTHEDPNVFAISYLDSPYLTLLDANKLVWLRRYATEHDGADLFAHNIRKIHGYTYFAADDTYFCVRSIDEIRDDCDKILNVKIKEKTVESVKKPQLNFAGLCDDSDEEQNGENEDEDNEDDIQDMEIIEEFIDGEDDGNEYMEIIDDEAEEVEGEDEEEEEEDEYIC